MSDDTGGHGCGFFVLAAVGWGWVAFVLGMKVAEMLS